MKNKRKIEGKTVVERTGKTHFPQEKILKFVNI